MNRRRPAHICSTDEDRYLPGPTEDRSADGCAGHTPQPSGYLSWHAWAEEMAKTHRQVRCPQCHLFAIWVPRRG